MTTNHHTPIPSSPKQPANAETFNDRLEELDQAISDLALTERDGHIIQDEGVDLAQQQRVNFAGAGVTVTNDAGNNRTVVTIPGGVTDHGSLSGLADDDHPQYLNEARGDARYDVRYESKKNVLRNSGMRFSHRGAGPFTSVSAFINNDDAYLINDWIYLANGADTCDISQVADTDFVSGYKYRLDVETANRRFGIFQVVSNADMQDIRKSGLASVRFKVKCTGSSISNVRVYLLAWDGTANVVTSDCISSWGSAGNDPTLVANWTKENTASNLPVTTTISEKVIDSIVVDTASVKNLGLLIIVDDTDASVGDYLELGDIKLESGAVSTEYTLEPYALDLERSEFYIRKSYNLSDAPGAVTGLGSVSSSEGPQTTGYLGTSLHFRRMASNPTITFYDLAGNLGKCTRGVFGVGESSNQPIAASYIGENGAGLIYSTGTSNSKYITFHYLATAEM